MAPADELISFRPLDVATEPCYARIVSLSMQCFGKGINYPGQGLQEVQSKDLNYQRRPPNTFIRMENIVVRLE